MTVKRPNSGRKKYQGSCSICGSSTTSRWYRKVIPNKVLCKSCYDIHRRTDPDVKKDRYERRSKWGKTFKGAINAAKRSGHKWTITEEEWTAKTQNCHYCEAYIADKTGTKLDRVDSNLPYSNENTVGCCKTCNIAKNNQTLTEFKNWIVKVYNKIS